MTRLRKFKRESFALWNMPVTEEERKDLLKTLETKIKNHKCKKIMVYAKNAKNGEKK